MKKRSLAEILICVAATATIVYLAFNTGAYPGTDSPEALGQSLGVMSLLPVILAVSLAFLSGQVIISLLIGFIAGIIMLTVLNGAAPGTVLVEACTGLANTACDIGNGTVLLLCASIGGMVEVLCLTGGFNLVAQRLSRKINTPKKANILSFLFCLLFFFDDYANALISGPVLKSTTDRAGLSRERLSYVIDSTAAPLAGISIVSSWIAVECSVIGSGLELINSGFSAFDIFLRSIPFRFYCILCILFVVETALMRREYGPMLEAEKKARKNRSKQEAKPESEVVVPVEREALRIAISIGTVALLLVFTVVSLYVSGRNAAIADGALSKDAVFCLNTVSTAVSYADTIFVVFCATLLCSVTALLLGRILKLFAPGEGIEAWLKGCAGLIPTIVILILAWSLSDVVSSLGAVYYVVRIISSSVPVFLVPSLIFVSCCLISFAAGSFGCMFMVMPMAIPIASAILGEGNMTVDNSFLLLCVSSVLSGSIFGDHCSPMTDCTILAALGSGCDIMDHVKTQMPYALTTAAVTCVVTVIAALGLNVWLAIILGVTVNGIIIRIFGKSPDAVVPE